MATRKVSEDCMLGSITGVVKTESEYGEERKTAGSGGWAYDIYT